MARVFVGRDSLFHEVLQFRGELRGGGIAIPRNYECWAVLGPETIKSPIAPAAAGSPASSITASSYHSRLNTFEAVYCSSGINRNLSCTASVTPRRASDFK